MYFCQYRHQILTDFKNSFTGTLSRRFAKIVTFNSASRLLG